MRGPEFEPLHYKIEKLCCPDIIDVEGRQILLPVMRPSDAEAAEAREKSNIDTSRALLKAMIADPGSTLADWGQTIQRTKGIVINICINSKKMGWSSNASEIGASPKRK